MSQTPDDWRKHPLFEMLDRQDFVDLVAGLTPEAMQALQTGSKQIYMEYWPQFCRWAVVSTLPPDRAARRRTVLKKMFQDVGLVLFDEQIEDMARLS